MANPTELELKNSLVLIHQTIYGDIPVEVPYSVTTAITSSIENSWLVNYRQDLYYKSPALSSNIFGPMTNNMPIDTVHWYAGPGHVPETGMEIWEQCMTLFMRHI
jgi:hypothetical protein